jgi:hypothetical protein
LKKDFAPPWRRKDNNVAETSHTCSHRGYETFTEEMLGLRGGAIRW